MIALQIEEPQLGGKTFMYDASPLMKVADVIDYIRAQLEIPNRSKIFIELVYKDRPIDQDSLVGSINYNGGPIYIKRTKGIQHPKGFDLPPRGDCMIPEQDPPDFQSKVQSLVELGFDQALCEQALRVSFFDVNRASIYLVSGSIPTHCKADVAKRETRPLTKEIIGQIKYLMGETGADYGTVIQVLELNNYDMKIASSILHSMRITHK